MRQRPGTAKGIVFITLEDEFDVSNLVIYPNIGERDRAAMIGPRLMVAEGRIERGTEHAEVPITHLICRKLIDSGDLLRQLSIPRTIRTGPMLRWDASMKCDGRIRVRLALKRACLPAGISDRFVLANAPAWWNRT
jgi:hypothetical protein